MQQEIFIAKTPKEMREVLIAAEKREHELGKISANELRLRIRDWENIDNMKVEKWYKAFFR